MAADLVIFDPATVCECDPEMAQNLPGNEKPLVQEATGIEMKIVNGEVLIENGRHTGALLGAVVGNGADLQAAV